MTIEIIERQINSKGEVYTIRVQEKTVKIFSLFMLLKESRSGTLKKKW
jgi:hypothetical protein